MGIYAQYLTKFKNFEEITKERKKMLSSISKIRGNRDVLVFASDLSKARAPIGIEYTDLLAIQDQLENLSGKAIDIVLETPGGLGEVVEDIVSLIRGKYETVGMIIPGYTKSAGTILATAGDEILMGKGSALGPIDGQLQLANGKRFSADAFLEGLEKIKKEVEETKKLNPTYIPILQNISPGEIQNCENIQNFSKHLVTEWLAKYKFKYWNKHSDGRDVTEEERCSRAKEIATDLCSQSRWLTHGRSIKIDDLEKLKVKITDYSKNEELNEAITRYYILLRMSFESSMAYKIFETADSQIYRFMTPMQPALQNQKSLLLDIACIKCKHNLKVQANLEKNMQLKEGAIAYPVLSNSVDCPKCREKINLLQLRQQIESQFGKRVVR